MRVLAALGAAAALAGCLESPPGSPGAPDADADAGPGAGADAGGCPPLLDEPWDGTAVDTDLWFVDDQPGDGTIAVEGGTLTLDANPGGTGFTYLEVSTHEGWPLAGMTATADLSVAWQGNGDAALLVTGAEGYIGVYADSGTIGAARDLGDGFELLCPGDPCPTTYSPALHRYWRVREAGGELHFEASDGVRGWVELAAPQPAPAGEHSVLLWSECADANRVTATVERVTVTTCPPG